MHKHAKTTHPNEKLFVQLTYTNTEQFCANIFEPFCDKQIISRQACAHVCPMRGRSS